MIKQKNNKQVNTLPKIIASDYLQQMDGTGRRPGAHSGHRLGQIAHDHRCGKQLMN